MPPYGDLKARLIAGEPCFGVWCELYASMATEILAEAGFDCLLVDLEHGSGSYRDAVSQLQAIKGTGCTPLIRVPWNDPVAIKRTLDIGAAGVMIPAISSPEEAEAAVAACKYPPEGFRGAAPGIVRATAFGLKADDYLAGINDKLLIVAQIETQRGVEAVEEIASVEGLDLLFIGPMDLSADIGLLGQTEHPKVQALIERVETATLEAGRALGSIVFPGRSASDLLARGHRLIVGQSDVDFIRNGALAALAEARKLSSGLP
ncbi:HpcH/HpaI aldolase family protein [Algihabitans albus]|uniref:HpcH/HpaI aldolase family protein n=1 Tax=Algihabitans albus TaxID=2164067 RepID=UPI000E5D6E86|nr:aldolase/citrate lyase family protein [Algihabitans albus]